MKHIRPLIIAALAFVAGGLVFGLNDDRTSYNMTVAIISNWSNVALLIIAVGALFYAASEVRAAHNSNGQSLHQARASFLLQLNERWHDLADQRDIFSKIRRDLMCNIAVQNPAMSEDQRHIQLRADATAKFIAEKAKGSPEFMKSVQYVSFFEFVGLMAKNGYIPIEDIVSLYKGPIEDVDAMFSDFIREWQKDPRMPPGLFGNLLDLISRVETHKTPLSSI